MKQALCTVFGIYSYSLFVAQGGNLFHCTERVQCGGVISSETHRPVVAYVCPTRIHRDEENRCCSPPEFNCCREATFFENNLTAVLSALTIVALTLFTLLIIICLCWEKCFLHKMVRRYPTLDYIARPEETEHLNGLGLPGECSGDKHIYEVSTDVIYRLNKDPL
ncbi:unnamed protein product [Thelazia callipaeda]|uniref:FMR1N protein n=1 Tax=Thelazia callipaeda TaxID=103827 RepID=A0A0N5CZW3_THECL|nr:unnamed protein product [Thelazia callipaeda]